MSTRKCLFLLFFSLVTLAGCNRANTPAKQAAPGEQESTHTAALEAGSNALQSKAPVNQLDIYLVGFHPMKDHPQVQMEAHHYCNQVNEDFAQCVLFDGNTKNARLNGIEYIISEKLFLALPEKEKTYWHPHNYEVLSGQLVAPGLPNAAEHQLMAAKMNSYGKTWHVWETDDKGKPNADLPLGEPHLAWSFNHDGEIDPQLLKQRQDRMKIDTAKKRQERADLTASAHPQQGVNTLSSKFPGATRAPEGVTDNKGDKHGAL